MGKGGEAGRAEGKKGNEYQVLSCAWIEMHGEFARFMNPSFVA